MKHSLLQAVWYHIRRFMQVSVFLLHAGLLVPGLVFWIAFILLHGDMTAFALASDNLISRYLTASTAVQQNFQNLLCAMATVIYPFFQKPMIRIGLYLDKVWKCNLPLVVNEKFPLARFY